MGIAEDLEKLHQASVRMDELASQAQTTEEVTVALMEAIGEWVVAVDVFVGRCQDREILADYHAATLELEAFLSKLEKPETYDNLEQVQQELPEVVSNWSVVITKLIQSTL